MACKEGQFDVVEPIQGFKSINLNVPNMYEWNDSL